MIYLFIHQSFPAQYVHVAATLAAQPGNRVLFLTQAEGGQIAGVEKIVYRADIPARTSCHPYAVDYDRAVRTGVAVLQACRALRDSGVVPDIVVGHSGWGETLLVKEAFPDTPLLSYFEYYYQGRGADVGCDPEFAPARPDDGARMRVRNTINHMSFAASDWGHTATEWQRSLFPASMQMRITPLHEGIDTQVVQPNPQAWLRLARDGKLLDRSDEVITYVARNLEPYRGFHWFMRGLARVLQRRPWAHAVVLGGDGVSYGDAPPYGGTYRQMLLAELGERIDPQRVHFLGQVPRDVYLNVLQVSSVHAYFSYPFVPSWSLFEAMAAGCLVVGSDHRPVSDVLQHGRNGLTVNAADAAAVCARIEEVLDHPDRMQQLRENARADMVARYDTRSRILPRWRELLTAVASGRTPEMASP